MPLVTSPLRYPGGKVCLQEPVAQILRLNKLDRGHYAEPYAGGCGLALALLFNGHVSDIHINDIDRSIWSFWSLVLNRTEEFVELMEGLDFENFKVSVKSTSVPNTIASNRLLAERIDYPIHLGMQGPPAFLETPPALFVQALHDHAPTTNARILAPGEQTAI